MPSAMSVLNIVNGALLDMGDQIIQSLTNLKDNRARTMNALYEPARDSLLRENPWNFAIKRQGLSPTGVTPLYEFTAEYPYPADALYIIETEGNSPYRLEGNKILSDVVGTLNIKYVQRITDPTKFDAGFAELLQKKLAYEGAMRLSEDHALHDRLERRYEVQLVRAKKFDGMEDDPRTPVEDEWETVRHLGGGGFRNDGFV